MTNKLLQAVLDARKAFPTKKDWDELDEITKIDLLYGGRIIDDVLYPSDPDLDNIFSQAEKQCGVDAISNQNLTYQSVLSVYAVAEKLAKMSAFI